MSIHARYAAFVLTSLALVAPSAAQLRLGEEFQVSSTTNGSQYRAEVDKDAEGNFVVVWQSFYFNGTKFRLAGFGRRFDAAGVAMGDDFEVVSVAQQLAVAKAPSGEFVVVGIDVSPPGSLFFDIFGQRYDAAGNTLGDVFMVNSYTTSIQTVPDVDTDAAGNFVVVWSGVDGSSTGIRGQRFDGSGNPLGSEFQVNTHTTSVQTDPAVASDAAGNFVVVWESRYQDGSDYGIYAQRYDAAGGAVGGEFRVNSYTTDRQYSPDVASSPDGDFMVVWSWNGIGDPTGIYAKRYDPDGVPIGDEFLVNSYTPDFQGHPAVAIDSNGNAVVVWDTGNRGFGILDIAGQRFDALGQRIGGEFVVNTYTTSVQYEPAVAIDDEGNFVVVWDGESNGDIKGVFGQRFAGPGLHLAADGSCPGTVDVTLSGAPPASEVAVVAAANTNGFTKGGALCPGTELEIGEPFQLPPTFVIVDGEGNGGATLNLGSGRCFLQALAFADCSTSNSAQVP